MLGVVLALPGFGNGGMESLEANLEDGRSMLLYGN